MAFNWDQSGAQTSVLETIALIVIIALVFWFLIRPQMGVLATEKDTLKQVQTENQQVDADKQKLAELVGRLKRSQNDLKLVDEALPLQARPTQMEYLVNELVTASGMKMNDLALTVNEQAGPVAGNQALLKDPFSSPRKLLTTSLDLSVSGGVDQFEELLRLMETNGRVIDVSTLDISNEAEAPVFKLKLKLYSYVP